MRQEECNVEQESRFGTASVPWARGVYDGCVECQFP